MAAVVVSRDEDFWKRAPELFELANAVGQALESSPTAHSVEQQIRELAAGIPETPDPLSDMDPYLRSALLTAVIHALRAEENDDRSELRIAVERIRQALRDVLDERPVWRGGPLHSSGDNCRSNLSVARPALMRSRSSLAMPP